MSEPNEQRAFRPWHSVRVRLLTGLVLVTALGLAGGGAATFLVERSRILATVDSTLLSRVAAARAVVLGASNRRPTGAGASSTKPEPFHTGDAALRAAISDVLPGANESSLGILNGRAAYVAGIPTAFQIQAVHGLVPSIVRSVADGKVHIGTTTSRSGAIRYVAVPVAVAGSSDRGIYVAAINLDAALSDLTQAFGTFWLIFALTILIVAALGWFIAGRLLQPIHALRLAASRVTSRHRDERIPVVGTDDLSELTKTVNLMLDRLDGAMTDQRQLLDDVRHELHTPITIVRGHLEVVDPNDPEDVLATRALAIDELDRISDLVEDLALLAETQRADPTLLPVDIAALTRQVFAKVSVLPDHDWQLDETADVTLEIDAGRMTQAWLQLANNAAKYSPPGSPIEIGSRMLEDQVELWVTDYGPGVPEEARERIFERFGRADTGRGIAGSGLGLSIVQAIVGSHGGRIELDSASEGTRFVLVLPRGVFPAPTDEGTE